MSIAKNNAQDKTKNTTDACNLRHLDSEPVVSEFDINHSLLPHEWTPNAAATAAVAQRVKIKFNAVSTTIVMGSAKTWKIQAKAP